MSRAKTKTVQVRPIRVGMVECEGRQNLECQELKGPCKLVFIRQGRLGLDHRGEWIELQAGETLLMRRNQRTRAAIAYPPDLVYFWLLFESKQKTFPFTERAQVARPRRLADLFQLLLEDQEVDDLASPEVNGLVSALFAELSRPAVNGAAKESPEQQHVRQAEAFIHTHFRSDVSAREVAESLHLNADYVGRIFKKHLGRTLVQEIQHARLREARLRLLESSDTIETIAVQCGFSDAGYFRRVFRRAEGVTPAEFRGQFAGGS